MRRAPIRVRVAAAFAVAMAAVLILSGSILYVRLGQHLALAIDSQLQVRAQDLGVIIRNPDTSLAEVGGIRFF